MRIFDVIKKKRDGFVLSKEEIDFFISELISDRIEDYQTSALLMAMFLNGLNEEETVNLTEAMMKSGDIIDLSPIKGTKVDKHSTGGVGDTTTMVLAPILAACGVPVAKMSGRGLGHTGGTIDKLESIPGFRTSLDSDEFINSVNTIGVAISGQTKNIAPADKRLYALRDVTATIDNYGLIASSIMSKKLASGADSIVLDVKCGDGAFMKTLDEATILAETMIKIGHSMGKRMTALITDMNQPLGKSIGNTLEVIEAIEVLKGRGTKELREVSLSLAAEIYYLSKEEGSVDFEDVYETVTEALESGKALEKLREMISNQGGNPDVCNDYSLFKQAKYKHEVKSDTSGYISKIHCEKMGNIAMQLGAGRKSYEDEIDMSAGIVLNKKISDRVEENEIIATFYTDKNDVIEDLEREFFEAIEFAEIEPEKGKLFLNKLTQ